MVDVVAAVEDNQPVVFVVLGLFEGALNNKVKRNADKSPLCINVLPDRFCSYTCPADVR